MIHLTCQPVNIDASASAKANVFCTCTVDH
jgi:hypothetical protein